MRIRLVVVFAVAVGLLISVPLVAHHTGGTLYTESTMTLNSSSEYHLYPGLSRELLQGWGRSDDHSAASREWWAIRHSRPDRFRRWHNTRQPPWGKGTRARRRGTVRALPLYKRWLGAGPAPSTSHAFENN